MKTSWKTTVGGLLSAISMSLLAMGDLPDGFPEWTLVAANAAGLVLLGATARDNNVSSEKAGAGN